MKVRAPCSNETVEFILVKGSIPRHVPEGPKQTPGPPTKVIATNVRRRDFGELTRGHEGKVIASISAQLGTMHGGDGKEENYENIKIKRLC